MIKTRTVLILGAGASMPYGYPSGKELKRIICGRLKDSESDLSRILRRLGTSPEKLLNLEKHCLIREKIQRPLFRAQKRICRNRQIVDGTGFDVL